MEVRWLEYNEDFKLGIELELINFPHKVVNLGVI